MLIFFRLSVRNGGCVEGLTKDEVIKSSSERHHAGTRTKFNASTNKVKELYYICGKERNVTKIIHQNKIFLPPIKIEPKPLPILYKKNDESCCMLLNKIRPLQLRGLIRNGENLPVLIFLRREIFFIVNNFSIFCQPKFFFFSMQWILGPN